MKSVRFTKVVEKSGRPEVYLLMSETDPDFRKALEAGKILSLSGESHGAGTEFGTVGHEKKGHGQLLLFPKSLKSFAGAKIIGIKYDLLAEDKSGPKEKPARSRTKTATKPKAASIEPTAPAKELVKKKSIPKPEKKVIPFPVKKTKRADHEESGMRKQVVKAMRALEKGNSVAAYNLLKQIISD